jgi:hypothetical protein
VLHGRVYDQIIAAADKLGVSDAIVMGSHRPELSDYLLGPNAARVVRHAQAVGLRRTRGLTDGQDMSSGAAPVAAGCRARRGLLHL